MAASSAAVLRGWRLLGRVCRELVAAGGPAGLDLLLGAVLEASRMERAFVVSRGDARSARPRITGCRSRRPDGLERPSLTILRRALAGTRPLICTDAAEHAGLAEGASVRSLSLRSVLAIPIPPSHEADRSALVLDSRSPLPTPSIEREVLEAFAALASLLLRRANGGEARESPGGPAHADSGLIGHSPPFVEMLRWVRRIAPYSFSVLITGATGSGKEGVARALHDLNRRRQGPFLAINCTAFPETLMESELFGAVRGAYTGSEKDRPGLFRGAQGGTLLLDEIGDMPLPMQAKLLRVLDQRRLRPVGGDQELEIDVRVIAATNRRLRDEVAAGRFRADLYHRIAVVEVRVPPLSERAEDIEPLAEHLVTRLSREHDLSRARISAAAAECLRSHDWPGNVRELQAVLLRGLLRASGVTIGAEDLDLPRRDRRSAQDASLERGMIDRALRESGGNIARAAARIGWTRQKLYRRITALGIERGT